MFKKAVFYTLCLVLISACSGGKKQEKTDITSSSLFVSQEGYTSFTDVFFQDEISANVGDITDAEKESLMFMREEEKLAFDVYSYLAQTYNKKIFQNISESELTHTNAVKNLLDMYSLEDPAFETDSGVYKNEDLQKLYNQLTQQGDQSLIDGLKVGAAIEEIDIIDIEKFLENIENKNIISVYQNLLRGSRNHLRAFVKNLSKEGITYQPQYLEKEEYEKIISADVERGRGF